MKEGSIYRDLWRRAVWNLLLGMLVAIIPAFAFYSLAFDYSPEQLRLLARLAIPGMAALLTVDLLVLTWTVRPLRGALAAEASAAESQRGVDRLLALPVLVLPRIFGPHAITATLVFNLLVVWANRTHALAIPKTHFPVYWLLNLTVVPIGHVVFEYHATERMIQQPLAHLLARAHGSLEPSRLVRLPLASRIFLFSVLLGMAPPVIGGFIAYQRTRNSQMMLPPGFFFQLAAVGGGLAVLWLLLLLLVSREVGEQTRSITGALERISAGDLSAEAPIRSISEFGRIALAVNEMAAGLRERQRLQQELAVARHIQQALLPKNLQQFRHFQVAGINRPCLAVGGDYFDLMELSPGRIAFVLADVCGKGLGAALITALLQGAFSTMSLGQERASVFAHINRFICTHSDVKRYATLFFGILDTAGRFDFVNAGHLPPLLIRDGRADFAYPAESFPLGLFEESEFKTSSAHFAPGDTLLLFTDGVTEAVNPANEQFGTERLREVVSRHTDARVEDLQAAILTAVEEFTRGAEEADDITLLIVRYCGQDTQESCGSSRLA